MNSGAVKMTQASASRTTSKKMAIRLIVIASSSIRNVQVFNRRRPEATYVGGEDCSYPWEMSVTALREKNLRSPVAVVPVTATFGFGYRYGELAWE